MRTNISRNSRGTVYSHENPTFCCESTVYDKSQGIIENESLKDSRGAIRNNQESFKEVIQNDTLGRYEIYIASKDLAGELGVALLDSGSQVSLVRE
jgi:hypothetical protein